MTASSGRVPLLEEDGRFPDRYAPPSVAADTASAQVARTAAEIARAGAETARAGAESARAAAEAVPTTNDGITKSLVQNPASLTAEALKADFGGRIVAPAPTGVAATDTAALQALYAKAVAWGTKEILLKEGVYALNAPLPIKTGLDWVGQGHAATTLRLANGANCDAFLGDNFATLTGTAPTDPELTSSGPHGWSIRALTLIGNKVNQTGTSWGIRVFGHGWMLRDVHIRDFKSGGLYSEYGHTGPVSAVTHGVEAQLQNVDIHHNDGWGWRHKGPNDSVATQVFVWENGYDAVSGGIWIERGNGTNLDQCHTYGNIGWALVADAQVYLSDNQLEAGRTNGNPIECGGVWLRYSDCVLVGGAIYDITAGGNGGQGLRLGRASDETYATRAFVQTMFNGFTGVDGAHAAIDVQRAASCSVVARAHMLTGGAVVNGAISPGNMFDVAASWPGATTSQAAAASVRVLRRTETIEAGQQAEAWTIKDGSERRLQMDTTAGGGFLKVGRAGIKIYSDDLTTEKVHLTRTGHVEIPATNLPTVAAGSQSGATPPSPQIDPTSNDARGYVNCGTGTAPGPGALMSVTFANAYTRTPAVLVFAKSAPALALDPYLGAVSPSGFTINVAQTPTPSQGNSAYHFGYMVIG